MKRSWKLLFALQALYATPLSTLLATSFPMQVTCISLSGDDARRQILQALCEAEKAGEPIVVFCSTV